MSECRCWNCLTHHNGDYGACENCSTVGRDRPSMWRPGPNYVPPTNADRIRAMSDDEFSYFLCDFRTGSAGEHHCAGCKAEEYCRTGHNGMIDWLQQPAKED